MLQLSSVECRALRARAHNLNPVVSIAENGLTEAVLKEIDVNLSAHELIKVRVYGDSREDRVAYFDKICNDLGAAQVQHIGKLLVIYRPAPADSTAAKTPAKINRPRRPVSPARKSKRSFQG